MLLVQAGNFLMGSNVQGGYPNERPLEWVSEIGCDAWILSNSDSDPLDHAASWNDHLSGADLEEALDRWSAYFSELGVHRIVEGAVILNRRDRENSVREDDFDGDELEEAGEQIQRAFANRRLSKEQLLHARLAPGASVEQTLRGGRTVSAAFLTLLRPCTSVIVIGSNFAPTLVVLATVAVNENALPPLSANTCAPEPPIELRSPVTVIPLLAGFVPGVTVTLVVVVAPGKTLPGVAVATPVGAVCETVTVREMEVLPVRLCASVIVTGRLFEPAVVLLVTIAVNEKLLLPLSVNACAFDPPIELRFARTAMPVLKGFAPGVTLTVSVVLPPASTLPGFAEPVPVGGLAGTNGVPLTSAEFELSPAEFTALTT